MTDEVCDFCRSEALVKDGVITYECGRVDIILDTKRYGWFTKIACPGDDDYEWDDDDA